MSLQKLFPYLTQIFIVLQQKLLHRNLGSDGQGIQDVFFIQGGKLIGGEVQLLECLVVYDGVHNGQDVAAEAHAFDV
jgi:hypothetical protein